MKKENPVKATPAIPKLANYKQVAGEWIKNEQVAGEVVKMAVEKFAEHLDSFKTLNSQLQILALQKTLETYIQFYGIVKNKIDAKVLAECLEELKAKHVKK